MQQLRAGEEAQPAPARLCGGGERGVKGLRKDERGTSSTAAPSGSPPPPLQQQEVKGTSKLEGHSGVRGCPRGLECNKAALGRGSHHSPLCPPGEELSSITKQALGQPCGRPKGVRGSGAAGTERGHRSTPRAIPGPGAPHSEMSGVACRLCPTVRFLALPRPLSARRYGLFRRSAAGESAERQ